MINLISHWKLDEASGNALDSHGSNELTETSGTIGTAAGKVGNARDLEAGDTEYFSIADNDDLSTGDVAFTLGGWVNLESKGAARIIASKGAGPVSDANTEFQLFYSAASDRFAFAVANGTADVVVVATDFGSPSTSTWYFVLGWHDPVANKIYISVNNSTPAETALATGVNAGNADFVLGASPLQSLYWDGLIDEFSFWKRVLTADERTRLYNGGTGLAYPFTSIPVFMHHYRQQGIA